MLISDFMSKGCSTKIALLNSMPIITCSGKRRVKVALELVDKSYYSTKNMWYYGLKLYTLSFYNKGVKGKSEELKQRNFAYENSFSKAVLAIRHPIGLFLTGLMKKHKYKKEVKSSRQKI